MASAVLANRNEPNWTQPQPRGGAKFMGKVPFSNPNPKLSKKRQYQQFQAPPAVLDVDDSQGLTQSAASDDASSINRRPTNNDLIHPAGYVSFNIATYTKKELIELKHRLATELEQIRQLKNRIESAGSQIRSNTQQKKISATNGKKLSGNKRPFPSNFSTTKEHIKRSNPEHAQLMKNCGQILSKLMKHKLGYIFNTPVDVEGLQLHDYNDIIKNPMDLGSVKTKLGKNIYHSPRDFAADVRLTFNNAMKYNPKGHEVYIVAEQFLSRFEELYRPLKDRVGEEDEEEDREEAQEVHASSWDHNRGEVGRVDKSEAKDEAVSKSEPIGQAMYQSEVDQNLKGTVNAHPVRTPSPVRAPPVKPVKQPKPKAKDPNKREMSLEEKHKLGVGLQSLPQEKMEQVVQIIRKRNGHLRQEGDEIELDIEAVDTETLWELDRFVTNYKKMVSKIKRQALMGINNSTAIAASDGNKDVSGNDRTDMASETKRPKKGDVGDEEVDIGDDMPMTSFPPVEIEKDNGHASSSSSSSSSSSDDSSSSSDSDSGSSSGSDSEDAHS